MAKDEREEGITGLPIPKKKMSPKKRHEFEKKRRAARKERGDDRVGDTFSQHRMTGSRGHGSEHEVNPRISYRHNEEYLIDYLLGEGFASDGKSAQAIVGAMSEEWMQSIIEAKEDEGKSKEEKRRIRTERSGRTGPYADYERRGAHRERDERNKDLADLRKGKKKNSSYFSYLP